MTSSLSGVISFTTLPLIEIEKLLPIFYLDCFIINKYYTEFIEIKWYMKWLLRKRQNGDF